MVGTKEVFHPLCSPLIAKHLVLPIPGGTIPKQLRFSRSLFVLLAQVQSLNAQSSLVCCSVSSRQMENCVECPLIISLIPFSYILFYISVVLCANETNYPMFPFGRITFVGSFMTHPCALLCSVCTYLLLLLPQSGYLLSSFWYLILQTFDLWPWGTSFVIPKCGACCDENSYCLYTASAIPLPVEKPVVGQE